MKKIIACIAVAALAIGSLAAEIRFSGFGRAIALMAVHTEKDGLTAGRGISWGDPSWGGDYNLGFVIEGRTNNVGFFLDVGFMNLPNNKEDYVKNYAKLQMYSTADQAKIWVKPVDFLQITAGRVLDKSMRGDMAYGMFDWLRSGAGRLGEGLTFSAFHKIGLEITATPINGLYLFAGVPLDEYTKLGTYKCEKVYKQIQAGAGYNFDGVGLLRAQYIGSGEDKTTGTVEAAFDLTMIENLKATVGMHYVFANKAVVKMNDDKSVRNKTENYFSAGAEYKYPYGKINALFRGAFNPNEAFGIYSGLGATYNLPLSWRVVTDVRYQNKRNDKQISSVSFLGGFEKELSAGVFGLGFMLATNGESMSSIGTTAGSTIWAVALRLEYRF